MLRKNALACILTEKTHHFTPPKESASDKSKWSAKILSPLQNEFIYLFMFEHSLTDTATTC